MKTIKIFIGSSIVDLKEERLSLMSFIQSLNNKYCPRGIFIEGYICEETDSAMRLDGSQAQHNDYVREDADVAIFMFYQHAGEFTLEEMRLAREAFTQKGKPLVYIFYKAIDNAPAGTEDIKKSIEVVFNEYGHYYKMFNVVDTIKLEILQCLSDTLPGKPDITIKDDKVFLAHDVVQDLTVENVFAYQNNRERKQLKEKINSLKAEMLDATQSNDFSQAMRLSTQLNDFQNTYNTLQTDILATLTYFSKENAKDAKADPRRMRALQLLECGNIAEAKALISQEEIDLGVREVTQATQAATEMLRRKKLSLIEDAKIRIQALQLDVENLDRFHEIDVTYQSVYAFAEEAKVFDFQYDYVSFLYTQDEDARAASLAEKLYESRKNDLSFTDRSSLCCLLSSIYPDTKYNEKEKLLLEAIECAEKLPKDDVGNQVLLAGVQSNLACTYARNEKPEEAEKLFCEVLSVYRRLSASNPDFDFWVAKGCEDLGTFYSLSAPSKGEELLLEALELYRKSLTEEPEYAEEHIALLCNNLAFLYAKNGKNLEAEKHFTEALTLQRKLALKNPAYESAVAMTCNNLGGFYKQNGNNKDAKKYYNESLSTYRKLAQANPGFYDEELTKAYNNLIVYYADNNLEYLGEALIVNNLTDDSMKIARKLAAENPTRCEPALLMTIFNQGLLREKVYQYDSALELYLEAEKLCKKLNDMETLANVYTQLASVYVSKKKGFKAWLYGVKALKLHVKLGRNVF